MQNSISISEELLDLMVNALAGLPYAQVQPIFQQLAEELAQPQDDEPTIIVKP